MIRLLVMAIAVTFSMSVISTMEPARAACTAATGGSNHVGAQGNGFNVSGIHAATKNCASGHHPLSTANTSTATWNHKSYCAIGGSQTCGELASCPDGSIEQLGWYSYPNGTTSDVTRYCPTDQQKQKKQPTIQDIETAFKQIPMSASALHVQPPHGETLVNFDTIFFTDPYTLDKRVTVLDATVDFHITVAHYTWHYGDGTTATTQDPGSPYPHQTITHRYLHKGTVGVSLDTTYQADYRINGGPQQHLNATVTIPSPPQSLTIRTATPHLVGS